jgi:hypothetical protein
VRPFDEWLLPSTQPANLTSPAKPRPCERVTSGDGIVLLPDSIGTLQGFALPTVNLGQGVTLRLSADTNGVDLPLGLSYCETHPMTGTCVNPTTPTTDPILVTLATGATPTLSEFVRATGPVEPDYRTHRTFARFTMPAVWCAGRRRLRSRRRNRKRHPRRRRCRALATRRL